MFGLTGMSLPLPSDEETSVLHGTPYRTVRMLGQGSMGSVFLAKHHTLGTEVVVKLLHPDLTQTPELVERLRVEAQAQARLRSPHLLVCSDFGITPSGAPFLVTEYLEGRTLLDEVRERRALPVDEALALTIQLLSGLAVAHAAGVVHRDVKPSNIFVTQTAAGPLLKLLDFGIAKVLESRTHDAPTPTAFPTADGVLVGTPRFCSPEQALSKPVDHRADLYSAALVLVTMLTGRLPYGNTRDLTELLLAQATGAPELPSAHGVRVPPELDVVLMKAQSKAPAERHQSAGAFIEDLEKIRRSSTSAVAPSTSALGTSAGPVLENEDTERLDIFSPGRRSGENLNEKVVPEAARAAEGNSPAHAPLAHHSDAHVVPRVSTPGLGSGAAGKFATIPMNAPPSTFVASQPASKEQPPRHPTVAMDPLPDAVLHAQALAAAHSPNLRAAPLSKAPLVPAVHTPHAGDGPPRWSILVAALAIGVIVASIVALVFDL